MPAGISAKDRQDYKIQFLESFLLYIRQLVAERPNLIIGGDYNICHRPIDIHDPVRNAHSSGFLPEERAWMEHFFTNGFVDLVRHVHPTRAHAYTWWSFRSGARERNKGWRIDYLAVSNPLKDRIVDADVLPQVTYSDHCPVMVEVK